MNLAELKSGTDLRGVAIAGSSAVTLTDEAITAATIGFWRYIKKSVGERQIKIAVGHDSRISSERIEAVVLAALRRAGCDVRCCGLCSTPAMFMMTQFVETDCDGSIMITASHHPFDKNGMKFFLRAGGVNSQQLDEIIELGSKDEPINPMQRPLVTSRDYVGLYCDYLKGKVAAMTGEAMPLEGLKIVVDASNGAAGFFADRVLAALGADVSGSQFLEPDGHFPNHSPNPENTEAMHALSDKVKEEKADLGIIFDADGDRAAFVSADGTEINRSSLIALVAAIILEEEPGSAIVTDSVTSDGLRAFIENKGGIHHRFKRGYRNVIDEAIRLENSGVSAPVAIETSGHAALRENYYLDDGAYLALRIAVRLADMKKEDEELNDLIADLKVPAESKEIRLKFTCPDWRDYGAFVIETLRRACESVKGDAVKPAAVDYEGVRVNLTAARGWFLVRMSVHDPIMVINLESEKEGGTKRLAAFLYSYMSAYSELDASPLHVLAAPAD